MRNLKKRTKTSNYRSHETTTTTIKHKNNNTVFSTKTKKKIMLNDQTNWKSFSCEKLNQNYCCQSSCLIFLFQIFLVFFALFCFVCCVLIAGRAHIKHRTLFLTKKGKKENVKKVSRVFSLFGRENE